MSSVSAIQVEAAQLQSGGNIGGTQAIMATLNGKVIEEMDKLLETYNAELVGINAEVSSLRQGRNALSIMLGNGEKFSTTVDGVTKEGVKWATSAFSKELSDTLNAYGYAGNYVDSSMQEIYVENTTIDAIMENIDSQIQEKNTSSELKMINFQAIMDSRKQALLMLSNLLNSDNTAKQAIIQNMKG